MQLFKHGKSFSQPMTNNRPIKKIAIIVAMREEALPMIEKLKLTQCHPYCAPELGLQVYRGKIQGHKFHLVINGRDSRYDVAKIGTDAATLCAYETLRVLKPDTIISAGTAGGYAEKGANIGDIYLSSGPFVFHDRRVPLEGYDHYAIGNYPCLEAPAMANALQLKLGTISTGNSLSISEEDQAMIQKNGAVAKEMEVASIANIAQHFGARVIAVKAITNLAGVKADASQQFQENFSIATKQLAETLPKILKFMLTKTPQQLSTPLGLVNTPIQSKL
jgi:5'-methylthioadenosine nucleosidase